MANTKIPIDRPVLINRTESFQSTVTLEYTGISITIPGGCAFSFNVQAVYMASAPQEIALSASSTGASVYQIISHGYSESYLSYGGYVPSGNDVTYYVWAKFASVANNVIAVRGWYKYV